jgi:hypothetical protein
MLLAATAWVGCDRPNNQPAPDQAGPSGAAGHDHSHDHGHHHGPHDGHLVDLGDDEFHAEVTHDDASGRVTIYLLDAEAKKPVATAAPHLLVQLTLAGDPKEFQLLASPQEGDPQGRSSRFELVDKQLCESWDATEAAARLSVTIEDIPFSGKIEPHDHGHDHPHP